MVSHSRTTGDGIFIFVLRRACVILLSAVWEDGGIYYLCGEFATTLVVLVGVYWVERLDEKGLWSTIQTSSSAAAYEHVNYWQNFP